MDFLDPKKQKAHAVRLWIGYVLIGVALVLASTILLYLANGFRINREGEVIQNGLVFMSSQPSDAEIYTDGKSLGKTTGARLSLPAGQYTFELKRDGYRTWQRGIAVEGGSVQRFVYPFLFPVDLRTESLKNYEQAPSEIAQSPSQRWLLIQSDTNTFDMFDLNSDEPASAPLTVPTDVLSANTTTTGWKEVQWADDNRHVILKRSFSADSGNGSEYILLDREQPAQSRNLTVLLGFNPTTLQLIDQKFDRYYAFDKDNGILFTASIEQPTPQPLIRNVLDFAADGPDTILYATNQGAPQNRSVVRIQQGDETFDLREVPRSDRYLLDLGRHQGSWVVAAGSRSENRVFVYKNPFGNLREDRVAAPMQILKVNRPGQISFSTNARFVMIRRGPDFAVFDAETDRGYAYELDVAENAQLGRAEWMDGHHMSVVAGRNLIVFDFDGTNQQSLVSSKSAFAPVFNSNYTYMYTLSPDNSLESTSLRTPEDE